MGYALLKVCKNEIEIVKDTANNYYEFGSVLHDFQSHFM